MRTPADSVRATPPALTMTCGRLPDCSRRHGTTLDGPERPSGRTATCGITPSTIMSPAPNRPRTEIRLGARAHTTANQRWPYPHAPPRNQTGPNSTTRTPRLTRGPWTDKGQSAGWTAPAPTGAPAGRPPACVTEKQVVLKRRAPPRRSGARRAMRSRDESDRSGGRNVDSARLEADRRGSEWSN
jgi:hypothetical protein